MLRVGAEHFSRVSSDNTGNTTLAHTLLQEEFSWIIVLPDSCHHMSYYAKTLEVLNFSTSKSSLIFGLIGIDLFHS